MGLALLLGMACDEYAGCTPVLTTDNGQLELHDQALTAGVCQRMRAPAPMLLGSLWCPAVRCGKDVPGCEDDDDNKLPDEAVAACYTSALAGPVADESPCLRMTDVGDATWTFTAGPCDARSQGYVPDDDSYSWSIVSPAEVTGNLESPADAFALRSFIDQEGEALDDEAALQPGEVAYAIADRPVPFGAVLRHPDHDAPVAYNAPRFSIGIESVSGPAPTVTFEDLGLLTVTIAAGAEAVLTLVPGEDAGVTESIELGTVVGVAPSDIVDLQIVPAFSQPAEDDGPTPGPVAGARAVARTAEGNPVYGADVQWSIEAGALPLWRDEGNPSWTPDYVALAEQDGASCHDPPKSAQRYDATIVATLGELSATADVHWTEAEPDDGAFGAIVDLFEDPPPHSEHCEGPGFPDERGCGCTTEGSGPVAAWLLALFGLALAPRRSHPTSQ